MTIYYYYLAATEDIFNIQSTPWEWRLRREIPPYVPVLVDMGTFWWNVFVRRGGHSNSLQYSCLENPREQRSLAGYNP